MNQVTVELTPEDWGDLLEWEFEKTPTNKKKKQAWVHAATQSVPFFLVAIFLLMLGKYGFFAALSLFFGNLIFQYMTYESTQKSLLRKRIAQSPENSSVRSVSLQPRGVLEITDVEERLTLWDAITEVHLTDKFLCSKDKRGGILLIPMRAFGSEAAAKLFQIEMDNHRMRHAVGLAPAPPVAAQSKAPIATPTVPQEAPPQEVTAGWWRKP